MNLKSLDTLVQMAKSKTTRRLAVAAAGDEHVLEAVLEAKKQGIVEPILVGDKNRIDQISEKLRLDLSGIEIINEPNPAVAAQKAVSLIKERKADVLMKGLVSTGPLLKAVLDKENGLRKGGTLSHIAFFESNYYHKLISVTDAAMNVEPELQDKVEILKNAVEAYHKLGIKEPKVAVVGAVESVNPKMDPSVHGAILTAMNKRVQIKGCLVDGPLALDNAVSKEAAKHKGIVSDVAGDVDIILTPDIYSGNVLYKSLNFLGGAISAAVIMGAKAPIVLTSRADSEKSKFMSIALAAAME
ncbi:MAG: phosphate butyryltransferase [Marinilabiliales bacterium]|nr:MAG: phosphate butyryltransferase [Marinilabiliales bacterium]